MPEKVERCVEQMMRDPKFRAGQEAEKRKSSAFAICTAATHKGEAVDPETSKKYTQEGFIIVKEHVPMKLMASIQEVKE